MNIRVVIWTPCEATAGSVELVAVAACAALSVLALCLGCKLRLVSTRKYPWLEKRGVLSDKKKTHKKHLR